MSDVALARTRLSFLVAIGAMAAIVGASNVLVQHPVQQFGLDELLTWGALSYPFAFLVTDLCNRRFGPAATRKVIYVGFALGVVLSIVLASPRIAIASGSAFLAGQLIDVSVFGALRRRAWWIAPLVSSVVGSIVDTALFFSIAFHCGDVPMAGVTVDQILSLAGISPSCLALPWQTLALADFAVKMLVALVALLPYRFVARHWRSDPQGLATPA